MPASSAREKSSETIANQIRARICLAGPDGGDLLTEGHLAQEFEVSRTPVRQALQRLAYERIVVVKSGVGTVVLSLSRDRKQSDIQVACALLNAAAECLSDDPVPPHLAMILAGYAGMLDMSPEQDKNAYFEIRSRMLETILTMVPDAILGDALIASYWRLVRWRLDAHAKAPAEQCAKLRTLLQSAIASARTGSSSAVLHTIAHHELAWDRATPYLTDSKTAG